ncbi:MAG: hypothetical protein OHK0013_48790 [Sandaracinaceae bacterium]
MTKGGEPCALGLLCSALGLLCSVLVCACSETQADRDAPQHEDAARVVRDARPALACETISSEPQLRVVQVSESGTTCLVMQFGPGSSSPIQYTDVHVNPGRTVLLMRTDVPCPDFMEMESLPIEPLYWGELPAFGTGWMEFTSTGSPPVS